MVYIHSSHKEIVHCTWGKQVIKQWEQSKNIAPTTWGTDWDYYSTANHVVIILDPGPCCIQKASIVTKALEQMTLYSIVTTCWSYSKYINLGIE